MFVHSKIFHLGLYFFILPLYSKHLGNGIKAYLLPEGRRYLSLGRGNIEIFGFEYDMILSFGLIQNNEEDFV